MIKILSIFVILAVTACNNTLSGMQSDIKSVKDKSVDWYNKTVDTNADGIEKKK
jgi:predicted small secreted protein